MSRQQKLQNAVWLHRQGRLRAAAEIYVELIRENLHDVEAMRLLGTVYLQASDFQQAEKVLQRALSANPADADVRVCLARALHELSRGDEARRHAEMAKRLDPSRPDVHSLLGVFHLGAGEYRDAEDCFRDALAFDSHDTTVILHLALTLKKQERWREAAGWYRRVADATSDAKARVWMAAALARVGDDDAAIAQFESALDEHSDSADPHNQFAALLLEKNDFDGFRVECSRAIEVDKANPYTYLQLVDAGVCLLDSQCAYLDSLLQSTGLADCNQVIGHFAMGHHFRIREQWSDSWRHLLRANELLGEMMPSDLRGAIADMAECQRFFTKDILELSGDLAIDAAIRPVFVVGMPRSGKSTVERLLACHSHVAMGSELKTLHRLSPRIHLDITRWRRGNVKLTDVRATLGLLGGEYEKCLAQFCRGANASMVSNSYPWNHLELGIVAILWPNAIVVHCQRKPIDIAWECLGKYFARAQPFGRDLSEIEEMACEYEALMAFWGDTLPIPIHKVSFEELHFDLVDTTNDLARKIGLDTNDFDGSALNGEVSRIERMKSAGSLACSRKRYEQFLDSP
ncbi:MAG: tetratricopeptide repeat protein [Planctomycetales bacterium]|nr:tetratricopeptide repeat protein [Planctomycetales bacterium]